MATRAIERAGVETRLIGNFVLRNVIACEPRDAYAARIAAIGAGVPLETPAHAA